MTRIRAALLLGSLLAPLGSAAQTVDPLPAVDSLFARWSTPESPGCAIGVSREGRPVLQRAYGMAELEHGIRNAPGTVFEAGSVSKQFTAAAVVVLARQGRLSLDDDVRRWVPELPDYGAPITLRHLLNHTSGLRDWGSVAALGGWPRGSRVHTHEHVLEIAGRQRSLNFPTGSEYSYSNTGYNLLAVVVERASGTSFAEFSRRELFEPLGLARTEWRDDYTRVVKGRATAYTRRGGAWHQQMPFENVHGNGGLLTTVADLLAWDRALGEPFAGGPPLREEMEEQGVLSGGRTIAYALGLFVGAHRGLREVSHSGATAGYRAWLAGYPEQEVSVAVLCNAADAPAPALARRAAELFLRLTAPAADEPVAAAPAPAGDVESLAGMYRSLRDGTPLRLEADDQGLRFAGGPRLVHAGGGAFRAAGGNAGVRRAEGGLLRWDGGGDTVRYERVAPWAPDAAELAALAGEYRSDEADAAYMAAIVEGRLVLRRGTGEALPLEPLYPDAFAGGGGLLVRVVRGEDGRPAALSLGVPRVRDLRFRRVGG